LKKRALELHAIGDPNNSEPDLLMAERELAVIDYESGYLGLVDSFRARANELRIALTGASAAQVSGLPSCYLAKILSPSPKPARRFGAISLGAILGTLQLKLIVTEDEKASARFGAQLEKRNESCVHNGVRGVTTEIVFSHKKFRQIQAKGRRSRWNAMSPAQRSAWARELNRIRWAKVAAKAAAKAARATAAQAKAKAA
jgi:hypothetical protein